MKYTIKFHGRSRDMGEYILDYCLSIVLALHAFELCDSGLCQRSLVCSS